MQNLRDKLLKAGLVSEDQAKTAETATTKAARPAPTQAPRREGPPPRREHDERPPRDQPRRDDRPRQEAREGGRPSFGRPQGPGGRPPGGRPQGSGGRAQGAGGGRPQGGRGPDPLGGPVPKLPPMPGSKAAQRMESKKQVEQDRKLRELVLGGQVPVDVGATVFYFMTRKGKLRRLELTEAQAKQLEEGALGVVERPEPAQIEHSLVPATVAEQMYELSKKSVRFLNRKESPIGFMSDDQVKDKQAAEARGEEPVEEPDEESSEAATAEAASSEAPASEAATAEAGAAPEGSSEPTAS